MCECFPFIDNTCRYVGELDRYDRTGPGGDGGGGGYHVTYDDGDEEILGEVDGRADVHLLGEDVRKSDDAFEVSLLEPSGDVQSFFRLVPYRKYFTHRTDHDQDNLDPSLPV